MTILFQTSTHYVNIATSLLMSYSPSFLLKRLKHNIPHFTIKYGHRSAHTQPRMHTQTCSPDWKVEDLRAGPPHVAGHLDQLPLQRVRVLGQLVQAEGPVSPPRVQLGLHRLWGDEARRSGSLSRVKGRCVGSLAGKKVTDVKCFFARLKYCQKENS